MLLVHVGFLSRLSKRLNQGVRIFIDNECVDRVVENLLKSGWSHFSMNVTWRTDQFFHFRV